MIEPKPNTRTWGFRFSVTDAAAITYFVLAAIALRQLESPLWWLLAIVATHFFLFCNVFRIIRRRELIWAGLFIVNTGMWAWSDHLTLPRVLLCQLPITIGLVVAATRTPRYHGVLANRLNPRLNEYLMGRIP